jgi:hypothetical protein
LPIFVGNAKNICGGFVSIFGGHTPWMSSQIPEHGLDEQVVCGDSHRSMVPAAGLLDYLTLKISGG